MDEKLTDQNKPSVEEVEFWESYYQTKVTPWDLGMPSPPFKSYLESPPVVAPGKMAVLGCGKGNDCLLFATYGFEVTGFDFAPSAVAETKLKFEAAGLSSKNSVVQKDIFNLQNHYGQFDYVLEHTCFCAIEPSRRKDYSDVVRGLLQPDGKFIALWWLLDRKSSDLPPFSVARSQIFELFSDFKCDVQFEPKDSVPDRLGQELFTVMSIM